MEAEVRYGLYPYEAEDAEIIRYFARSGTTYQKGNVLHVSGTSGSVRLGEPIPTVIRVVSAEDYTTTSSESTKRLMCWLNKPGMRWWVRGIQTGGMNRYGDLAVLTSLTANRHRLAVQSQQGSKAHVRIIRQHPDNEPVSQAVDSTTSRIWLISMTPTMGM